MSEVKNPCILVECPHCHNDIWIQIGISGGWDIFFEGYHEKICYECLGEIKGTDAEFNVKESKSMSIDELSEIENFEKFNKK